MNATGGNLKTNERYWRKLKNKRTLMYNDNGGNLKIH